MDSPIKDASHSPEPINTQQAEPSSPNSLLRPTSQILGQSSGAVFTYNAYDELSRLPITQFRHPNGKLYIEYVPGNNVLFLPTSVPIDRPLKRVRQAQCRKNAQDAKVKEPVKPHNAFIQYRSYRLGEIKRLFPNASQLDLSRIAAEHWRTEDPSIKGFFQKKYKEELQFYHQQLKIEHMAAEYRERIMLPGLAFVAPVSTAHPNTQSAIDYLNKDGPFQFNPKRRHSQSVPPETPGPSSSRRIRKV
ncbi:hypothetical protein GGH96_004152 [Coemansia sp. RSA 1972]|nr:hypothetical protein GGH96_004152 [Coemansia sp. RSA 1972]